VIVKRPAIGELDAMIRFGVVGFVNTLTGLGAIYLLKWQASMGDGAANVAGYALGLTVSFVLNRTWTFRHSGPALPAAARFLGVFAVAYLANIGTVLALVQQFGVNGYLAQALGIPPYTVLFYIGSRYVAFRGNGEGRYRNLPRL
jgi:putative flippase GtrA